MEQYKTEQDLFQALRKALQLNNGQLAREIYTEYGRRGYTHINGEPLEDAFKRNPGIKPLVALGEDLRRHDGTETKL